MAEPSAPPSYDDALNNRDKGPPQYAQSGFAPNQVGPYPPETGFAPKPDGQQTPYPPSVQFQPYPDTERGFVNPQYTPGPAYSSTTPAQPNYAPNPVSVEPVAAENSGFSTSGDFSEKAVRRVFIRKVFITLGFQLAVTFGIVCIFFFIDDVKEFVQENSAVYFAAYAVFIVIYLVLICSTNAVRKHPANLIMLIVLTLALSYMVGTIASFYDVEAVTIGLGVTVVVCVAVIIFSMQTKFDFTKCGGLLFVLLLVLIIFGFVTIFTYYRPWYLQVVYGSLGALVFTLFLAFDTQLVMGGRKYELSPEEYVFGALILYIDVVYIFLFILAIFGGSSK